MSEQEKIQTADDRPQMANPIPEDDGMAEGHGISIPEACRGLGDEAEFVHPADLADHLENLSLEKQVCALRHMPTEDAAEALAEKGIEAMVIDMYCIKPLDREAVLKAAATGKIITVEEHVAIGGMGSMAGSVVAAIVLTAAPEALRAFDDYRMIVYSLLLIATMIFKPSGLLGRYDFSMKRIIEKCVNGELFASFRRGRGKGAEEA